MGFSVNLLTGIGEYLQGLGAGKWAGPYAATDTAIVSDSLPATPDKAIALTLYTVEDTALTDSVVGLQCRVRGKPNDRITDKDIADGLFDALHDLKNVTLGGVPVVRIWRQSESGLGPDGNNRQERTANYYIHLTREGTNRSD